MKHSRTIVLTFLVVTFSSIFMAQPVSGQHKDPAPGTLSGLILQPDGTTWAGARITVERKGFRREILSANDGSYAIDLPKGKYKVSVRALGFYPSRERVVELRSKVTTKVDITLSLPQEPPHPPIRPN